MPGLEGAGRRRDGRAHRQELLRRHRPGHDRDGDQRPDHRRRHAAGRAGLLGRRRLATGSATRERAQALVDGWKRACDPAASPGAAARRRRWPASSRAAASTSRRRAPASSARRTRLSVGDHLARRRRDRAAGLERHPRQRPEPGAQARRAPAAGLPDAAGRSAVPISYGEALLAPTVALFAGHRGAVPGRHPAALRANITGHGWRKLLRHPRRLHLPHPHACPTCRRC